MAFVVGALLCRSENCLVADFLIFAIYVDGKEIYFFSQDGYGIFLSYTLYNSSKTREI